MVVNFIQTGISGTRTRPEMLLRMRTELE